MNNIIIWKDISLFLGVVPRGVSEHQHPALQLVLGIDEPFKKRNSEGVWEEKKAVIIPPNSKHECDATDLRILSLGIEIETRLGQAIIEAPEFDSQPIDLSVADIKHLDVSSIEALIREEKYEALYDGLLKFFSRKYNLRLDSGETDERIAEVLEFIRNNIDQPINTESLCQRVCLSESRLLHLFKQEMGLPIRNYLLWQRLKIAIEQVFQGASLTEAAYGAGFSDLAHMTRTFVKTIGVPPSAVKDSRFVQVSLPE